MHLPVQKHIHDNQRRRETQEFIEADPIQEILAQNAELMAQNQQLAEELQQLKSRVAVAPGPAPVSQHTAVAAGNDITPFDNPANAWEYAQTLAQSMVEGEQKTEFLQDTSKLIEEWQETQDGIATQQEHLDYLQLQAQDDPTALSKLPKSKQDLSELQAASMRAQRDLHTLIEPYRKLQQPQAVITPEPQYGNLSIAPLITITEYGQFVITIQFTRDNTARLSDIYNLSTGQGMSGHIYPSAFCRSIYRQIGRMRRTNMVTWSRAVSMQEKVDFANIITNMPRTMTATGY